MKSYLEIGLRSFRLKVVRGKLKVGSCKVLPDLSFLLSVRPIVEGSLEQGAQGDLDRACAGTQCRSQPCPSQRLHHMNIASGAGHVPAVPGSCCPHHAFFLQEPNLALSPLPIPLITGPGHSPSTGSSNTHSLLPHRLVHGSFLGHSEHCQAL